VKSHDLLLHACPPARRKRFKRILYNILYCRAYEIDNGDGRVPPQQLHVTGGRRASSALDAENRCTRLDVSHDPNQFNGRNRTLTVHLLSGTAEDASALSKQPGEAPTKTEHSESSSAFARRRARWAQRLNGVVAKPGPHESNPDDRARSVSLRPRGWSLRRGLYRDTRATVLARVVQ